MIISQDETGKSSVTYEFPPAYHCKLFSGLYGHEELAKAIADNNLRTYMLITIEDRLAEEHWDDPEYLHKTNHIIVSRAVEEARDELRNKYYSEEECRALMTKHDFPLKEFNFKEDEGRSFIRRIEDEIFSYQEMVQVVKLMTDVLKEANLKLDEEGYPIERIEIDEDGDEDLIYEKETDPKQIEINKSILLERYLFPRSRTSHDRVYNMPEPLDHWDYRSYWHQLFCVEIPSENITLVSKGGNGSSGAREYNGRWAHTFGQLAKVHGIETPTSFFRYTEHNVWQLEFVLSQFATLTNDLSGNYHSTRDVMKPLFEGRIWNASIRDGTGWGKVRLEKAEKAYYW